MYSRGYHINLLTSTPVFIVATSVIIDLSVHTPLLSIFNDYTHVQNISFNDVPVLMYFIIVLRCGYSRLKAMQPSRCGVL